MTMYDVTVKPGDRSITCPRCGYDQRGAMATWDEKGACPLEGTCAECGLTFLWRDLLRPTFSEPRWCVEHAPRRVRPLARSIVGTFARQWLPWKFWRQLQLQHRVRLRRVVMYLFACAFLPGIVLYVATQTTVAVTVRYMQTTYPSADEIQSAITHVETVISRWTAAERLADASPHERARAVWSSRFRAGDTEDWPDDPQELVGDLDQETWAPLWNEQLAVYESQLDYFTQLLEGERVVEMGYLHAVFEAVATPWRSHSAGQIVEFDGTITAYPAPRELHVVLGYLYWQDVLEIFGPITAATAVWVVLLITYPLTFLLLPITRRRAKVRWIHFARITGYSIVFPIVLFFAALLVQAANLLWWENTAWWLAAILLAAAVPVPVLLAWWYCAIRFHLRLPNALPVTLIMALLNGLIVLPLVGLVGAALEHLVNEGYLF